jgi:hypothetical protein
MPVTRAVLNAMIASGCPEAQTAGLAECLQISTVAMVNPFVACFAEMNFIYAMSVRREFRVSFIRWHNANCLPDNVWEPAEDEGTWDDIDWPEYEENIKPVIVQYLLELAASQFLP